MCTGMVTFAAGACFVAVAALARLTYVMRAEARRLVVQQWDVGGRTARPAGGGGAPAFVAVHMTDLHYDPATSGRMDAVLERAVDLANEQGADAVFLTGDYVNVAPQPAWELADKHLKRLKSKCGVFAVIGNHDQKRAESPDIVTRALASAGITVLRSSSTECLDRFGNPVHIIGLDHHFSLKNTTRPAAAAVQHAFTRDFTAVVAEEVRMRAERGPRRAHVVVLSHSPDSAVPIAQWADGVLAGEADKLQAGGPPLVHLTVLAGHVHGGQFCFWEGGPPCLAVARWLMDAVGIPRRMFVRLPVYATDYWQWAFGQFQVSEVTDVVVSRGLGSHMGIRLSCPPDIGVLRFW
ncbi:hypothetical protein DIPPA_17155 [Diplonema papillatum]|nr:hypothetical protein DIPPA_17155 [Diplonema papillatum]